MREGPGEGEKKPLKLFTPNHKCGTTGFVP